MSYVVGGRCMAALTWCAGACVPGMSLAVSACMQCGAVACIVLRHTGLDGVDRGQMVHGGTQGAGALQHQCMTATVAAVVAHMQGRGWVGREGLKALLVDEEG